MHFMESCCRQFSWNVTGDR